MAHRSSGARASSNSEIVGLDMRAMSENNAVSDHDIAAAVRRYVSSNAETERLLSWASTMAARFYIRNIVNTKTNIEDTKFDPRDNMGIEYSKDAKNGLWYRNKPLIPTNAEYTDLCDMIRSTSGVEKDILRYALFGIKCLRKGVEYNIEELRDHEYKPYFNILDEKYNPRCPSCRSKNTIPMMVQMRAADEPPTVRYTCRDCQKHFAPPRFRDRLDRRDEDEDRAPRRKKKGAGDAEAAAAAVAPQDQYESEDGASPEELPEDASPEPIDPDNLLEPEPVVDPASPGSEPCDECPNCAEDENHAAENGLEDGFEVDE
uniref:RPO30-like protein n=1 Tax=Squirrelpox virus TaxID=240426 RepID=Q0VJ57_9POXV|nr:RPO30-like protein [Squirrelpox virus]